MILNEIYKRSIWVHIFIIYMIQMMVEKKQIHMNLSEMYSQSYSYEAKLVNQATGKSSLKEQGPYTFQ